MIIFKEPRVHSIGPAILGGLIAAGGSVLGGILGSRSSSRTNRSNIQQTHLAERYATDRQIKAQEFNAAQAAAANVQQSRESQKDRDMQSEFAKHGVGWKIADARKSGIDPLAALGSNTFYSPVGKPVNAASTGTASPGSGSRSYPQDYSWLGSAGQSIGSAVAKAMTQEQLAHAITMQRLQEESLNLDNDFKQMRNIEQNKNLLNYRSQSAVPFPSAHSQEIPGQNDSVEVVPNKVIRHQKGHTAGVHAMRQYRLGETQSDGSVPIYSAIEQEAGDAMDADFPTKLRYNVREGKKVIKSWFKGTKSKKPNIKLKGHYMRWNRIAAQWEFVPNSTPQKIRRRYQDSRDKGTKRQRYRIIK